MLECDTFPPVPTRRPYLRTQAYTPRRNCRILDDGGDAVIGYN